jgi:hypothetical protein
MREMPHGQWVAFDGPESVHECGQLSDYGPEATSKPNSCEPSPRATTASLKIEKTKESPLDKLMPEPRKEGLPGWLDSLLGFLMLIFILWLISLFSK